MGRTRSSPSWLWDPRDARVTPQLTTLAPKLHPMHAHYTPLLPQSRKKETKHKQPPTPSKRHPKSAQITHRGAVTYIKQHRLLTARRRHAAARVRARRRRRPRGGHARRLCLPTDTREPARRDQCHQHHERTRCACTGRRQRRTATRFCGGSSTSLRACAYAR